MDFVIMWVDGDDNEWKKKFSKYSESDLGDKREVRFRDWDNLHYWFRAIEKYANWVDKIHFVTEGHIPTWLNTNNAKLNIVKHSDFIDSKYLPLFNSRAIEINLYKIKGLSEQFVYFNDDMFLTDYITSEFFFKDGFPCDSMIYNPVSPVNELAIPLINNLRIINKNFTRMTLFNKKIINYKYGIDNIRNIILQLWPVILGYYEPHQPASYLKTTFETIWKKEKDILIRTTESRFKNDTNVNQYLFRYWQLASGKFIVRSQKKMKMIQVVTSNDIQVVSSIIKDRSYKIVCINDSDTIYDFNKAKQEIQKVFLKIFPKKSSYER